MKIGNLVASVIAFVWGSAVLVVTLLGLNGTAAHGGAAYQTGHTVGFAFAVVLLIAGGRGVLKELGKRRA